MRSFFANLSTLTLPFNAGPGQARIVLGGTLPPPLDTYMTISGPYEAGIIFYSEGDDTTYTYLCDVANTGAFTEVHLGHVRGGAVQEYSPGEPAVMLWQANGSGLPVIKEFLADQLRIGAANGAVGIEALLGNISLYAPTGQLALTAPTITLTGLLQWAATANGAVATLASASDNVIRTTAAVAYTSVLAPAGTCGVTFVAPQTGVVSIAVGAFFDNTLAASFTIASAQVRAGAVIGAGGLVVAATDDMAPYISGTDGLSIAREFVYSGLTPGDTYNAEILQRVTAGTGTYQRRTITVRPEI